MLTRNVSEQVNFPAFNRLQRPLIARARFQLLGCLLAPLLAWLIWNDKNSIILNVASNTLIGTALAALLGFFLFRKISRQPGGQMIGYIIPIFAVSFMLVFSIFLMLRLDYSRIQFFSGFVISLLWFGSVFVFARRAEPSILAIIPVGDSVSLMELPNVHWQVLPDPPVMPLQVNGIVADLRADHPPHWQRFITDCVVAGTPVFHVKQVRELLTGRIEISHLSENTLGSLNPDDSYLKFKRAVDSLTALLFLIAGAVPLLLIAIAIKIDSPGSAIFKQERVGRHGRVFTMYKFRTMTSLQNGMDPREASRTRQDDSRITRFGRILRRTRFDELPQAFNVLTGEMSWIGPRPEAVPLARWYESELPFYGYRHIVSPGITGWAQVNQGHVTSVEHVSTKLNYDFYYIKNFSLWLDLFILMKTVRVILSGFGSK